MGMSAYWGNPGCCVLGGLAAEEFGELAAWGPSRRHPDAEETATEHTHLDPRSAQEHEMETIGSASTKTAFAFILHRYIRAHSVCLEKCTCVSVVVCAWTFFFLNVVFSFLVLTTLTLESKFPYQLRNRKESVIRWNHSNIFLERGFLLSLPPSLICH